MALFAVSAIAMVIGSYLFVLLLAAACVYLPYLILANSDSFSLQIGLLFLFGIVIAVAMLWSLIPRRDKFKAPGMLLDRATQPRLFAELESIASALNETLPSEVHLIGAPNAFVADRGGVMGLGCTPHPCRHHQASPRRGNANGLPDHSAAMLGKVAWSSQSN